MKTKERISKKEVNIYIVKDGNLIQKKSKFEENNQIAIDELCLLKMTTNKKDNVSLENVYTCLLDNGYTVIRLTNRISQIFLGYIIKKKDKELILNLINTISNKKIEIYNRIKTSYGRECEIISINDSNNGKLAIKMLLNEKTNELDEKEKKILNSYRDFDLKKLLLHENNEIINNSNSGVMIITNKELICSTLRKKNCKDQIDSIIENLYNEGNSNKLNIINIQIQSDKKIIIDMPEKINEFQYKALTSIIKLIKSLKVKEITFVINEKDIKIEEFEKKLKQKDLINNDIKAIKFKEKDKIKKIGNIEIKSILKIKNKENTIGEKIRRELEEYALNGLVIKGNAENKIIGNKIKNAEVFEIISKMEDKYIKKMPLEIVKKIKVNKKTFSYNTRKKLKNQEIQEDTIKILSYINLHYWCNKAEKEELEEIYRRNEEKAFNNTLNINSNKSIAVIKQQNWLTKLIQSIKKILGSKQEVFSK